MDASMPLEGSMADYLARELESSLLRRLGEKPKVILVFGARQVGKTTMIRRIITSGAWGSKAAGASASGGTNAPSEPRYLEMSGDDALDLALLSSRDGARLRGMVAGYDLLFVDEAQRIPEIGINLKLLHDAVPGLRIIATGSSALDLESNIREALTGRCWTFNLHPFSQRELLAALGPLELERQLERDLVYGCYPESHSMPGDADRSAYLQELHSSYLFKDILELGGVRHPRKIVDLLRLIAFQIGSEVSFSELGNSLGMSKDTVASYIDLLEKSFIVFRLPGYSRNLRSEVTRSPKIYFHDNGVRNAAINDFRPFRDRPDKGALWENFLISERNKLVTLESSHAQSCHFWRLRTGAEIDYVEESNGRLSGWEFKLSPDARASCPKSWKEAYPDASWTRLDRSNYLGFLSTSYIVE
jgi:uncharacterized protein